MSKVKRNNVGGVMSDKSNNIGQKVIIESGEKSSITSPFKGATWYDAVIILLLTVVAQGIGGVLAGVVGAKIGWVQASDVMRESVNPEVVEYVEFLQSRYITLSLFFTIIIGFVMVVLYARMKGWRNPLSFKAPGWASPFRLLCGYVLLWCMSIVVEPLAELLPGGQDALGGGGWLLVSAVCLAPLFEEVIFRGYIAGLLRSAYGGVVAWLFSSLLFGVLHVQPSVILTATCGGLVLGYYYLRYRSLVMVIMLHAMNNITACFLKTVDLDDVSISVLLGGGTLYWIVYGVSLFIVLASLSRMVVDMSRIKSDNYQVKK